MRHVLLNPPILGQLHSHAALNHCKQCNNRQFHVRRSGRRARNVGGGWSLERLGCFFLSCGSSQRQPPTPELHPQAATRCGRRREWFGGSRLWLRLGALSVSRVRVPLHDGMVGKIAAVDGRPSAAAPLVACAATNSASIVVVQVFFCSCPQREQSCVPGASAC
jgi:hypothetical protein